MEVVKWFSENWTVLVSIITQTIGIASIIVKLTPGIKDDEALANVIKFIGKYIALNVSREEKLAEIK